MGCLKTPNNLLSGCYQNVNFKLVFGMGQIIHATSYISLMSKRFFLEMEKNDDWL
jgi:hypothetical protein